MARMLLLLCCLLPNIEPHQHVGIIEYNIVVYGAPSDSLKQYIFWETDDVLGTVVVDYAMDYPANVYCKPVWSKGYWMMLVSSRGGRSIVRVISPRYIETISNFDPEVADRDILKLELRRGLGERKVKTQRQGGGT
jgi:hypothetical protein